MAWIEEGMGGGRDGDIGGKVDGEKTSMPGPASRSKSADFGAPLMAPLD